MANVNTVTIEPGSSLAELIKTLDLSQVPAKLHCQSCKGFLLNAYKTSCCEQSICENCFEDLPDRCPFCAHNPFSQDLCRAVKGPRGTAKAYLKSIEKSRTDSRDAGKMAETSVLAEDQVVEKPEEIASHPDAAIETVEAQTIDSPAEAPDTDVKHAVDADGQPSIGAAAAIQQSDAKQEPSAEQDTHRAERQSSESSDDNDDEVEIQVEPSREDEYHEEMHYSYGDEEEQGFPRAETDNTSEKQDDNKDPSNGMDASSFNAMGANMGFNNGMDMNPMAIMQQMMMNGINPMMGMSMGMNAGMFGGLAGQNGGMNGMNMGMMNFNPNQNMFGWNGQNSNSWQNNNANPFQNGMGGDFGSQFGFDMSQQGNFQQQQFRNGDFQNGYAGYRGRGRGRGRGGFNRGRGSFNQYSQNNYQGFQNGPEQLQNESQQMQAQTVNGQALQHRGSREDINDRQDVRSHPEDFAPGGQDEVNEVLKEEAKTAKAENDEIRTDETTNMEARKQATPPYMPRPQSEVSIAPPAAPQEDRREPEKPIPEAYHEDVDTIPPPSAPSGPSGRHGDRDYGFRSRGPGRFASRSRGPYSSQNGHSAPSNPVAPPAAVIAQSPPAKGTGVQGAPTGPRAMREPPAPKPSPRATGGFQIIGRAAMKSQSSLGVANDRLRSPSPATDQNSNDNERNRRQSRHDRYDDDRYENESEADYERNERDRRRRRSRRDDYDDQDMRDVSRSRSRSNSYERISSHRSSRYDKEREREKEKYSSSHKSSRRHHEDAMNGEYDQDVYDEPRDERNPKHRSSHRSSGRTVSRHEEGPREKEDRHRKRSRHDRDREEEFDEQAEEESRHRSRRHKKDHHHNSSNRRDRKRDTGQDEDDEIGLRISGRSAGRNISSSALPTPTSATTPTPMDKDPHTLEREARNRERMEKETQRRQKAAQGKGSGNSGSSKLSRGTVSGGRRVSYKYEDEVERGMDERDSARWH